MTDQPLPEPTMQLSVLLDQVQLAVRLRDGAAQAERQVVTTARGIGLSWDRIGELLGVSGETLRRRSKGVAS